MNGKSALEYSSKKYNSEQTFFTIAYGSVVDETFRAVQTDSSNENIEILNYVLAL